MFYARRSLALTAFFQLFSLITSVIFKEFSFPDLKHFCTKVILYSALQNQHFHRCVMSHKHTEGKSPREFYFWSWRRQRCCLWFSLLCITRTELRASAPRCADTIFPGAGIASLTCLSINICHTGLIHLDEPALIWKRVENTSVLPLCWINWCKYRNKVSKRSLKSVKMHSNGILYL